MLDENRALAVLETIVVFGLLRSRNAKLVKLPSLFGSLGSRNAKLSSLLDIWAHRVSIIGLGFRGGTKDCKAPGANSQPLDLLRRSPASSCLGVLAFLGMHMAVVKLLGRSCLQKHEEQ